MFVVYKGSDEVLVTTVENESTMLREYFLVEGGRDLDEYDRSETKEPVVITQARMHLD